MELTWSFWPTRPLELAWNYGYFNLVKRRCNGGEVGFLSLRLGLGGAVKASWSGYNARMSKRRGRKVVLFAGAFAAITLASAGACWKGFIERYYFYRIWRDPAYILAIIERPEGTPERRAIRRYFRRRPAVLEKEKEEEEVEGARPGG